MIIRVLVFYECANFDFVDLTLYLNPKLILIFLSMIFIVRLGTFAILFLIRFLSITLICSNMTIDGSCNGIEIGNKQCVGKTAFEYTLLVIQATIVVGLCLFPTLF